MRYLTSNKPVKDPQTIPMAVGSAFDAYIKSYLHEKLFGKNHKDASKYEFGTIFESQVEIQNRKSALVDGKICFDAYKNSGALADLMIELDRAADEPKFEFDLRGVVRLDGISRELILGCKNGIPLLGKPDLKFINHKGAEVILDFKVNGFYGKGNTSPMPGYCEIREFGDNWMRKGCHKEAFVSEFNGLLINCAANLEHLNEEWARQLSIYGWLLGADLGREMLVGIEQIVANNVSLVQRLRIASHRCKIGRDFQFTLLNQLAGLWSIIETIDVTKPIEDQEKFYFFRDMSFEDSKIKCRIMEERAKLQNNLDDSDANWVINSCKQPW